MAPLISMNTAKHHLKVDDNDSDADIAVKLAQATATILQYLKSQTVAIATISVANPTVITTSVPHSLVSGTTYTILSTTTTPTVNGAQVATVTGPKTFTVPVNVTVGQSAAAGTVGSPTWTESTVPGAVQASILLLLQHLRGDYQETDEQLWQAIERLLWRSRDPALA